jgi:mannose-6-phosphate isomerase-like protein (cupin superfamily)
MAKAGQNIENRCTGERITWIETAGDTKGARLRFYFSVAPGGKLPVTHLHPGQSETFELSAGVFQVSVKGQERTLKPGDTIRISPGQTHTWSNPSAIETAQLTATFEPALNTETFLEQLFGLANDGKTKPDGAPPFLQIMAMVNRYEIFIAGPPVFVQRIMGWTIGGLARLFGYRAFDPRYSG